jgi:ubiquinone/menaquinone biosynthesis C-methylase UbiE
MDSLDIDRLTARLYDRLIEPLMAPVRSIGLRLHPARPGLSVLDIACGTGSQLAHYLRAGCRCAGVDISPEMLEVARSKLGPEVDLREADATALPFCDESFDLITISMALHELRPPVRAAILAEARRVVASDGHLLVTDYHPGPLKLPVGAVKRAVITAIELSAGPEHFTNYLAFLASGGLPPLVARADLRIERVKLVGKGNMGLFLLVRAPE